MANLDKSIKATSYWSSSQNSAISTMIRSDNGLQEDVGEM